MWELVHIGDTVIKVAPLAIVVLIAFIAALVLFALRQLFGQELVVNQFPDLKLKVEKCENCTGCAHCSDGAAGRPRG